MRARLIDVAVPTVAVLLGQGAGGGALAPLPADRVLAAGYAWLAPLAPEGASAIVYRDTAHAAELARPGHQHPPLPHVFAPIPSLVSRSGFLRGYHAESHCH